MKISIITATYNSEKTIRDTIESVLSQNYENFEHIIIDGGSRDNTMKIVKEYKNKYHGRLKYISEKDKGIYDAMNKGIKMSSGDIIGLLNSDDKYYDNNVLSIINENISKKNVDGVYADLLYVDSKTMKTIKRKWISGIGKMTLGWMPAHPTLYLKNNVYKKVGLYNLKYKICADYDFMVRLFCKNSFNIKYVNRNFVLMRHGGTSSNGIKGYYKNVKEAFIILKNNKVKFPLFIIIIRIFKTIFQFIGALFANNK